VHGRTRNTPRENAGDLGKSSLTPVFRYSREKYQAETQPPKVVTHPELASFDIRKVDTDPVLAVEPICTVHAGENPAIPGKPNGEWAYQISGDVHSNGVFCAYLWVQP
jgi:hypothetical protein